jgi:hypothetical protein
MEETRRLFAQPDVRRDLNCNLDGDLNGDPHVGPQGDPDPEGWA